MHSRFAILLSSINLILAQGNDPPVINTPASVVQCLPALLTYHGGVPPYTLSAIPAGQAGAAPLVELGSQTGDSYTWIANLPAGTATTLQIRDSRGNINYSQAVTIQNGNDDSCLKPGATPSPTNPPSTGPATPPSSAPPSTTTGISPAPPAKGGNNTSSPPAGRNTTTPGGSPNTTSPTSSSTNTTKGPSIFVPPTNTSSSTPTIGNTGSNAANNAPASDASSVSAISQQAFVAGLIVAASVMTVFA